MTGFQLKLLALVSMALDHVGAVLFPQITVLRIIGRLSFPIFCYLMAEGLQHTSSVKRYLGRLFLFAFLSEIPFDLAFHKTLFYWGAQNVFFTLGLGLVAAWLLKRFFTHPIPAFLGAAALAFLAESLHTDYGWFGVVLVVLFYCCREQRAWAMFSFAVLNVGYSMLYGFHLQPYALAALIPILLYNGKKGRTMRYLFYVFYPAHLLLLYFLDPVFPRLAF